ncbi:MAG: alpha/beta fold hydrolase [Clostridia bacterium]|nr:alpha/beta fold hydrolase [Clostridia bacterium]
MVVRNEFHYPSSDGVHAVHAVEWLPESEPKAVVQLVHGISEYIVRYDDFARFLAEHGYAVVGNDHLGHGLTAKSREEYGYLAPRGGWRHLLNDVRALRVMEGDKLPGLPYFILGHSMGSFLTRTYLITWPGDVDGAILSGTGQESAPLVLFGRALSGLLCLFGQGRKVNKLLTKLSLGAYNTRFAPNRTGSDWISRDTAAVDAYVRDPLCRFVPTVGMFHDMMGGLRFIASKGNLRQMDSSTPIYFFSGDADPVGANGKGVNKVVRWFRGAGVRDITVKLYPGGRHEMLNETNRGEVYEDVLNWLNKKK